MVKIESKKTILAIGMLTLVLFVMVGITSAAGGIGPQSSASTPPATIAKASATTLSVVGNWNLYYDWSGSGTSYSSAVMTVKSDGTFVVQGETGRWTQVTDNGMIIWKFANNCVYSGNVAGKTMTGIMSLFPSSNGVWYAIKQ
jgi:hypothetical protein